jgi:hypothetical protein
MSKTYGVIILWLLISAVIITHAFQHGYGTITLSAYVIAGFVKHFNRKSGI